MAERRRGSVQAGRGSRRIGAIAGASILLLLIAMAIAVALIGPDLLRRFQGTAKRADRPETTTAGLQADTDAVMKACAIGIDQTTQSEVKAGLERYFRGLNGSAKVTSAEIGAIADKVTDPSVGPTLYKLYTDCLKQQMAIALSRRGIPIQPADGTDIEAKKDQEVRDAVALIGPDTPSSRLAQIFGQPFSERSTEMAVAQDTPERSYRFVSYSFRDQIFADEVFLDKKRLAIILRFEDEERDRAVQLKMNQEGDPFVDWQNVADCEGGFTYNIHVTALSGLCGGSHADDYQYRTYVFFSQEIAAADDENSACYVGDEDNQDKYDAKTCPMLAKVRPRAVVMSRDGEDASEAGQVYLYKISYNM